MGKRWFYRFANLRNRKKKVIKLRLTKKHYKSLYFTLNATFKNNYYLHFLKFKSMYYYLLKYRQLLQKLMGKMSLKKVKKIYIKSNKTKTRMYLFNFLSSLELRLNTTLFHSFILIQVNLINYLTSCNLLLLNDQYVITSKKKTHPLDIIAINVKYLYTSQILSNLKILSLHKKLIRFLIVKFFRLKLIRFIYFINKKKINNYLLKKKLTKRNFLKNSQFKLTSKLFYQVLLLFVKGLFCLHDLQIFYAKNKFFLMRFYFYYRTLLKILLKVLTTFFISNCLLLHLSVFD